MAWGKDKESLHEMFNYLFKQLGERKCIKLQNQKLKRIRPRRARPKR